MIFYVCSGFHRQLISLRVAAESGESNQKILVMFRVYVRTRSTQGVQTSAKGLWKKRVSGSGFRFQGTCVLPFITLT